MSLRSEQGTIYLEGRCLADDAESLQLALQQNPGAAVDIGGAQRLHLAVVQVLLVFAPPICGNIADARLAAILGGQAWPRA